MRSRWVNKLLGVFDNVDDLVLRSRAVFAHSLALSLVRFKGSRGALADVFLVEDRSDSITKEVAAAVYSLGVGPPPTDDGGKKAKARLVVRGYTDPDLVKLRAESPTRSKVARHIIIQLGASNRWTPHVEICEDRVSPRRNR